MKPSNIPDEGEVRSIVERAWHDNVVRTGAKAEAGYAWPWLRLAFGEKVGEFVRGYFRKTGRYPFGSYDVHGCSLPVRFGVRVVAPCRSDRYASLGG